MKKCELEKLEKIILNYKNPLSKIIINIIQDNINIKCHSKCMNSNDM